MKLAAELFVALVALVGFAAVLAIVIPAWLAGIIVILFFVVVTQIISGPAPTDQVTLREGPDDWQ